MTVLRNNFSTGPDGTTVSTSNSGANGDDPFEIVVVTAGAGNTCVFRDSDDRASAEFVMETTTASSGSPYAYVAWTTSMGAQSTIYTRWYTKFAQIPSSTTADNSLFMIWNGATHCCSVWVNSLVSTGRPLILPGSGPSTSMATVLQANVWNRFEFKATMSTTVGAGELRLYAYPNEDGDTPTETLIQTNKNYGAATGSHFRMGNGNPLLNQTAVGHSTWELNNTGWPGAAPFRAGLGVPGILSNPIATHTANNW